MERAIVSAGGAESPDYLGNSSVLGPDVICAARSDGRHQTASWMRIRRRGGDHVFRSSGLAWRIILTGDGIISETVCPPDVIARGGAI